MTVSRRRFTIAISCAWLLASFASASRGEPGPAAEAEIGHLLTYIQTSTCRFVRNGREYDADRAYRHVMRKYRYFAGMIESAEDFIALAATESTMSGKPYQFVCNGQVRESGPMLLAELDRFRGRQRPNP